MLSAVGGLSFGGLSLGRVRCYRQPQCVANSGTESFATQAVLEWGPGAASNTAARLRSRRKLRPRRVSIFPSPPAFPRTRPTQRYQARRS